MIDNLKNYLAGFQETQRLNHLREYVQWLILKAMDEKGQRRQLAFVGGTALRVIHKIERFSEDLDFSATGRATIDGSKLAAEIQKTLNLVGLEAQVANLRDNRNVLSFFINFPNLLYPLKISPHKNQPLSIKIEVDNNPPQGAVIQEYLFADPLMFWINHYDMASLFAGKIHALLFRGYNKGRDFYDLVFFLKKKAPFNFALFQNAAQQTKPEKIFSSQKSVFKQVVQKIETINFDQIRKDLRPFLLNPEEERFINPSAILTLLRQEGYL